MSSLGGDVSLTIPDFSAAWPAARASEAASHLDYEWMIGASRADESYEIQERIADRIIDGMSSIVNSGPNVENLRAIHGRLLIFAQGKERVLARLEDAVEES